MTDEPKRRRSRATWVPKKFLRPGEAAEMYSVSVDWLAKQPADVLPRIKIGRKMTLYAMADLDELFEQHRVT